MLEFCLQNRHGQQTRQGLLVNDFMLEEILRQGFERVAMLLEDLQGALIHPLDHGLCLAVNVLGSDFARLVPLQQPGLVLLLNSNGQYVFLPTGWSRRTGSAIAVPKSEQVRLDYRSAGSRPDSLPTSC